VGGGKISFKEKTLHFKNLIFVESKNKVTKMGKIDF